jgi:diadenylate cyclase
MDPRRDIRLLDVLEHCAPGEPLREGLDRILRSGRGALIVLGDGDAVQQVCSGGFVIDADFTAHRLSELAKMDGAIICDEAAERIRRANVHLVPPPQVPTSESGIRHRTAERTARQTHAPVVAVSEAMHTVTLYVDDSKYTLERADTILTRANQALQTLQRYRLRFDEVASGLSGLEVEDLVTLRDVMAILQRAEMVLRIADEVEWSIVELGRDGRLVRMQLDELLGRVEEERELVVRDYYVSRGGRKPESVVAHLAELSPTELVDQTQIARVLGHPSNPEALDTAVTPRGYRLLAKIPRIPRGVEENIVKRFGSLPKIMRASLEDLDEVEGVGEARARMIKEGLSRLADTSILERYT